MGIQRNISTVASLMKEILRNQNHADISVMATSRKQVTHLLRINVVYQIVKDHVARFAVRVTKVLRYGLVIIDVCGQLMTRRDRSILSVTPDYTAVKFLFV